MPDLTAFQEHQDLLIRKALNASVFAAPYATALPASYTSGAGGTTLTPLASDYVDVGFVTKSDAYSWGRATDLSEIESHGSTSPTRRDINKIVTSLQFTAQETKKKTLELYYGLDLSTLEATVSTGETTFDEPVAPDTKYHRIIAIAQDGTGADTIYIIRTLPRAMVSESSDQSWSDGDDGVFYPMTITAQPDAVAGTAVRHTFAGPGWLALLDEMGIDLGV